MVLNEEHHQQPRCSSRPPSRKNKPKKIPQRGLGVAQLEKIRIEEMQKTSSNINSPGGGGSPSPSLQPSLPFLPPMSPGSNAEEIRYLSSMGIDGAMSSIRLINSTAAFTPASSGVNIQAEPPSNQNYNTNPSSRREEERVWPFHPEVPQFKSISKEVASSSNSCQVGWRNSEVHINKRLKESAAYADNGFLTLGSSVTQSTSKLKQPMVVLPEFSLLQSQKPMVVLPEFSLLQSQGGKENAAEQPASSSEKTFYSFLPMRPAAGETDGNKWSDEAVGGVDTSLKL